MDTARHDRGDRIRIAQLCGTASRHAAKTLNGSYIQADAVGELHTISSDPHLLAHAAGPSDDHLHAATRRLLEAAGACMADLDENTAIIDRRQERGMPLARVADRLR